MKRNKGITLIALVITIIVLLILAGVAISMLSGENGILKKAAEAKTKTEQAQKEEETTLKDMELAMNFFNKNSRYKIKYGCITGVACEGGNLVDTVGNLKNSLPDGYYVVPKGKENIKENEVNLSEKLTTGAAVKKGDEIVYRVALIGDVDGNGTITGSDAVIVQQYIGGKKFEDYEVVAMNIYNDEYIGTEYVISILELSTSTNEHLLEFYQNVEIKDPSKMIVKNEKESYEIYFNSLTQKSESFEWKWAKDKQKYKITGDLTAEITGDTLIEELGLTGKAYVRRVTLDEDEEEVEEKITTQAVQAEDEIVLTEKKIIYGNRIGGNNKVLATIWRK